LGREQAEPGVRAADAVRFVVHAPQRFSGTKHNAACPTKPAATDQQSSPSKKPSGQHALRFTAPSA
jgi:hypothetical protein